MLRFSIRHGTLVCGRVVLLVLGALCIVYRPLAFLIAPRGDPLPGQASPVLFFSPDCPECQRSEPLLERLVTQKGWRSPLRIDSRFVSSIPLRRRFDAAYHVPPDKQGHVPALFQTHHALIRNSRLPQCFVYQVFSASDPPLPCGVCLPLGSMGRFCVDRRLCHH